MKIHQLFLKDVSRPIDGVIKADDNRHLDLEVEEFVVTREVGRALDQFVERYLEDTSANGVWISGFFGSGKSHLLKILSLLLDQRTLPSGRKPADVILPNIEDEILRGSMERAVQIPSHSILFNIDQKADHIGGDTAAPILEVFVKVLNELRGYHGKQGHIAKLEYDLDKAGQLAAFKQTYLEVNGREWEKDRDALATARRKAFNAAYAKHFGVSEEDAVNVLNQIRDEYRVSIESFAEQVREYIDQQGKDFRLNFFVDEVGQFIGQDSKLMLNLQTVAESLATKCDGRSWVFVTSQGDLQKVLGELKKEQGDDFTKIQGRFKTRPNLTSADVREVIQRRLLAKTEAEPEALTKIFDEEKENLQTLFRFSDDSVQYKGWRGSDEFCDLYPFHPYQFDLFQRAIEQLSKHDAFTGKHTSVGERSMLEVFQSVAKSLKNEEVGSLATFDRMFDGITANASNHLRRLRDQGLLEQRGKGSATYYVPTDRFVTSLFPDLSEVETGPILSGNPPALSGNLPTLSGNPSSLSGNPPAPPADLPAELTGRIQALGQRVSQPDLAQLTVELCRHRPFSADELATSLGKNRKYLLDRVLTPLLRNDQLRHTIPEQPNHPDQAYTVEEKDE